MTEPYVPVDQQQEPTSESLSSARAEGRLECFPCDKCGENVMVGERVALLTSEGEVWVHPHHVD